MADKTKTIDMTVCEIQTASLASIAADDATGASSLTMTRGGTIISSTYIAQLEAHVDDEGPFEFGISHKGLTIPEVEAFLENAGPLSPDDKSSAEVASRSNSIKRLGYLQGPTGGDSELFVVYARNQRMILKFDEESAGWQWWVYNHGAASSAGSQLFRVSASHFVKFRQSG